jgi:ligand-binding sensor domain-containing protein
LPEFFGDWEGNLWLATNGGGVSCFNGKSIEKIRRFTEKDGIVAEGVNAFYEDSAKALWIATDGQGLYRYKNGVFSHFTSANGLYFDRLFAILEDAQGNLRIGISFHGAKFRRAGASQVQIHGMWKRSQNLCMRKFCNVF